MLDTPDDLDLVDDDEEDELPPALLVLTSANLDHDEETIRQAGDKVNGLLRSLLDQLETFEEVDKALSQSEAARARKARTQIRSAIHGFETVIAPTSNACDAFMLKPGECSP